MKLDDAEFYLVGGCVRDMLLGRKYKDRDYVVLTEMSFDELTAALEKAGATIFVRKPEFLTLRIKFEGEVADIAFPRIDGEYKDGRRPESVTPAQSLREDASRRDFTINAMYLDNDGRVLDYFGGQRDLVERRIRTVGSPGDRFREDYLRILRALRFSVVLRFDIAPETEWAMTLCSRGLAEIAADRIRDELNKALVADPLRTFNRLQALVGVWDILRAKGLTFELTQRDR